MLLTEGRTIRSQTGDVPTQAITDATRPNLKVEMIVLDMALHTRTGGLVQGRATYLGEYWRLRTKRRTFVVPVGYRIDRHMLAAAPARGKRYPHHFSVCAYHLRDRSTLIYSVHLYSTSGLESWLPPRSTIILPVLSLVLP